MQGKTGRSPEGARPVDDPTLEKAYLAFMAEHGRVEAAQEGAAEDDGESEAADPEVGS